MLQTRINAWFAKHFCLLELAPVSHILNGFAYEIQLRVFALFPLSRQFGLSDFLLPWCCQQQNWLRVIQGIINVTKVSLISLFRHCMLQICIQNCKLQPLSNRSRQSLIWELFRCLFIRCLLNSVSIYTLSTGKTSAVVYPEYVLTSKP